MKLNTVLSLLESACLVMDGDNTHLYNVLAQACIVNAHQHYLSMNDWNESVAETYNHFGKLIETKLFQICEEINVDLETM